MSDKMGPMTYGQKKDEIFIGRDLGMHRDFSEDMAKKIDAEVRSIVDVAYKSAKAIVIKYKDKLLEVSEVLLDKESLDGIQLDRILGIHQEAEPKGKNPQSDSRNRSRTRPPRRNQENRSAQSSQADTQAERTKEQPPRRDQQAESSKNERVETKPENKEERPPRRDQQAESSKNERVEKKPENKEERPPRRAQQRKSTENEQVEKKPENKEERPPQEQLPLDTHKE